MKKEIDRKLLTTLKAQDPRALESAIDRYSPYVAGVLRKVLGTLGTREDLEEKEILIGRIPASLCPYAAKARWYQAQAAGPDAYRKPGVLPEGVVLTSAVGAYGQAVSEHLLAVYL